ILIFSNLNLQSFLWVKGKLTLYITNSFVSVPASVLDSVSANCETNDSMYWTCKSCKPDKDEFSIIGVQVMRKKLHLSILIRDMSEVHRYYHLHESEIPIQQLPPSIVTKFIETLLILRNILIVNMTLLHNASLPKSGRLVEYSSTIDSDN
ncbi:10390_t:CDS:2, partial [Diversispora eburnea]